MTLLFVKNLLKCKVFILLKMGLLLFLCACYRQLNVPPAKATQPEVVQSPVVATATKPEFVGTSKVMYLTPTPVVVPTITPGIKEEKILPTPAPLTITVIYDNNEYDHRLKSAWGFAALVEYRGGTILFDTGGDGPTLVKNMHILGIDPTQIERVVLSHAHGDHTGGLSTLLEFGACPTVYLPPSFSSGFKNQLAKTTHVIEVTPGLSIAESMFTTGEMGRSIPEQALVILTERGLAIITGCAHPGIVEIVEQALQLSHEPVRLVLGGFHLGAKSETEIDAILADFRRLGVERVAPCHCTGERAISMFAAEYGKDFVRAGVGRVVVLGGGEN